MPKKRTSAQGPEACHMRKKRGGVGQKEVLSTYERKRNEKEEPRLPASTSGERAGQEVAEATPKEKGPKKIIGTRGRRHGKA